MRKPETCTIAKMWDIWEQSEAWQLDWWLGSWGKGTHTPQDQRTLFDEK